MPEPLVPIPLKVEPLGLVGRRRPRLIPQPAPHVRCERVDAPPQDAPQPQHAGHLPVQQVGRDRARDHRRQVRRPRVCQLPLGPAAVRAAERAHLARRPRQPRRPLHRVVAVLGVPVVGAEEARLELAVRPVAPPHVLLHHDIPALRKPVPLLHTVLAVLRVRRPLQQHRIPARRVRPVHIRPQHRPIPHLRPHIRLDRYTE